MPDTATERLRVYLNKVHLKGFKSIEDLTIDIQKGLNILIGKNGAGKSNFLEFVNQVIEYKRETKILFKYASLKFTTDDNHTFNLEIEKELYSKVDRDDLDNWDGTSERFFIDNEPKYNSSEDIGIRKEIEFKGKKITIVNISMRSLNRFGYQYFYALFLKYGLPEKLAAIEFPAILKADIEDDGYLIWGGAESLNFVSRILFNLELLYVDSPNENNYSKEDIYQQLEIQGDILNKIKQYTPIEDLRFNPNLNIYKDEKSLIIENVKLDFKVNGNWLPWSQLSDGTKRLFYIVSEVTYNDGIILIEEPELGIHPHQFNLLMDFLKEQSEDKQIIISTHSPKALDILSPDELNNILIAYYDKNKGTQIRHLTETEEQKAKRYMKEVGFFSDYWLLSDLE